MTTQPEPEPRERDAPPERRVEEDEMRYPGHGDPDEIRDDVGLDEPRSPDPEDAPETPDAGRDSATPVEHEE